MSKGMDIRQKAERLASRPYTVRVVKDETTEGAPIFVAFTPEMEGCIGQGRGVEEAVKDLRAAQIDFIQSLLEDDLPVPDPQTQPTITTSSSVVTFEYIFVPNRPLDERGPVYSRPESKNAFRFPMPSNA